MGVAGWAAAAPIASVSPLVDRLRRLTGAVLLVAIAFSQAPGSVLPDTKLDLVVNPGGFLTRALQAWDPQASFGELQNQAYGYLFPMGPFFWLGHAAGLPAWVVQRLWWATLLVVAYAGFVRLARTLGIGGEGSTVIAALVYALGPRVITELGAISVETLPLAMLPWVLLPLVHGARGDPGVSPRRTAALSGLAVAAIGGVNAAATAAVLVVPLLWLLSRDSGRLRRRLVAWWLGAVALATAWWVLPLLVLGRYAYPFLSYIENARVTTSVDSAANVLRGTDHWLGFLLSPTGPGWPAGWTLATSAVPAAATVLVAGLGLAGLAARGTPERRWLGWCLLVGMLLVGVGYAGVGGSPLAAAVDSLLDGPLAPLRNVHKFDPVLRLPLTLGLAAALARVPAVARRLAATVRGEDGRWLRAHPSVAPRVAVGAVMVPLLLATAPAWTGALAPPGGFVAVPTWWSQTADWLAARDDGRALLEPASAFADYVWGRPGDEPLAALARSPWAVRDAVPLGAPGATRLLDGVEALVSTGRGSVDLAGSLERAGIRYVVLRNDLAPDASPTPPAVARATLVNSPGLTLVARFGRMSASTAGGYLDLAGPLPDRPAVEIFAVGSSAPARAELLATPPTGLSGGPEALAGTIPTSAGVPFVAVADGGPRSNVLVTDTLRRRARNMGSAASDAYGPTLPAGIDPASGRPAADVLPYDSGTHQTTSMLDGAVEVSASSSAADPLATGYLGPAFAPYSAVDADPATTWVSDVGDAAPTLRVDFGRSVPTLGLVLDFRGRPPGVGRPAAATVRTGTGSWTVTVRADRVAVPAAVGASSWVQVVLREPASSRGALGLSEIDGLPPIARSLVAPADSTAAGPGSTWAFVRAPDSRRACVDPGAAWVCAPSLARSSEETGPLDRTFGSSAATPVALSAQVLPVQGPLLDALLDSSAGLVVSGSSQLAVDAADRPGAALDADPATAWITTPTDAAPRLTVDYGRVVTVSGLALIGPKASRQRVQAAVLLGSTGVRTADLSKTGSGSFAPMATRTLTITLRLRPGEGTARDPLVVAGLQVAGAPPVLDRAISVPCGRGPTVDLDGAAVPTALTSTRAAVLAGLPLSLRLCGGVVRTLPAGPHRLVAPSSAELAVYAVTLASPEEGSVPLPAAVTTMLWGPERRLMVMPAAADGGTLVLDEGYNPGWVADIGGRRLEPVRVDGWRQAWAVPPDLNSAVVVLTFRPGTLHRAGLVAGALALVLLLLAAVLPARRSGRPVVSAQADRAHRQGRTGGPLLTFAFALVLAGPVGLLGWVAGRLLCARSAAVRVALGSTVLALLVGVAGSAGWALVRSADSPWWFQAVAQGLTVALVVAAVSAPGPVPLRGVGAPGVAAVPPAPPTTR